MQSKKWRHVWWHWNVFSGWRLWFCKVWKYTTVTLVVRQLWEVSEKTYGNGVNAITAVMWWCHVGHASHSSLLSICLLLQWPGYISSHRSNTLLMSRAFVSVYVSDCLSLHKYDITHVGCLNKAENRTKNKQLLERLSFKLAFYFHPRQKMKFSTVRPEQSRSDGWWHGLFEMVFTTFSFSTSQILPGDLHAWASFNSVERWGIVWRILALSDFLKLSGRKWWSRRNNRRYFQVCGVFLHL